MKQRIQGMIIGSILTALLLSTVTLFASTVTRQITYGVRVNLNGQIVNFPEDMRPFVMGGRTYMPLRAMADTLELPVDFNASTNTVYLGNRFAGHRAPLRYAAPYFDKNPNASSGWTQIWFGDTVTMGGVTYSNALNFRFAYFIAQSQFTLHNLNGQYRVFSGYMGRVDGTRMQNVTVNIRGDGVLLQSFDLRAADMPVPFSVFVEDIQQLRLEVAFPQQGGRVNGHEWSTRYAIVGYLE